jgi:hypothetical protein
MTKRKSPPVKLEAEATGGRKRVFIDQGILKALAEIQCTVEEAAAVLGVSKRLLLRRFEDANFKAIWETGQAVGRVSLRRLQFRHAKMPNSAGVQMTIHLSKHHLGQTEKAALELSGRVDSNVELKTSARDRVNAKLDALAERIARRVDGIAIAAGATPAAREPVGG